MAHALFTRLDEGRYLPQEPARGPWDRRSLHGGPVAALLAGATEEHLDGLHPARVTVELIRPVPVAPLTVTAEVSRPGGRVRRVAARLATKGGTVVATATVLGIRTADVAVPEPTPVDAPPPPSAAEDETDLALADDYPAFHNDGVKHRFVRGGFHDLGPATDWIRLAVPVLEGEEPTPLQRAVAAADCGNGISRLTGFDRMLFINPDLTVHLHRLPEGEWVGLEAATVLQAHGVGLADSALWDERGPIGRAQQPLLVESRD